MRSNSSFDFSLLHGQIVRHWDNWRVSQLLFFVSFLFFNCTFHSSRKRADLRDKLHIFIRSGISHLSLNCLGNILSRCRHLFLVFPGQVESTSRSNLLVHLHAKEPYNIQIRRHKTWNVCSLHSPVGYGERGKRQAEMAAAEKPGTRERKIKLMCHFWTLPQLAQLYCLLLFVVLFKRFQNLRIYW